MVGKRIEGKRGRALNVIREIGRGGFGVVYLAEDDAHKFYAVKLIAAMHDPAGQRSFEQEIESTAGLSHENLLAVLDYGTATFGDREGLFAVTEYCPDGDYRRRLASYNSVPTDFETVVCDFRQILAGLSLLHSKIVHRDLKPENVLVSGRTLKIGDYGLAKFIDEATRTFTFKGGGTPCYMAPEVWLAQRATAATDLYALGVMLFETSTGRAPFLAPDVNGLREMHLYSQAPRAKSVNPHVPDTLDGIIRKLLAKEPQNRFQTAAEVLQSLTSVPAAHVPLVAELAARMRQHHDVAEAQRIDAERRLEAERDSRARIKVKEQEVVDLLDDAVNEINQLLVETKIECQPARSGKEYQFGNRVLRLHFFRPGELYENPEIPGRMEILTRRHAVHGGYIEIKENGEDREGWNLVLVRPPESIYGEWRIVESRVSALAGRATRYEPVATEARLLADNLACHWMTAMHSWVLNDKVLERDDILKILKVFVPRV